MTTLSELRTQNKIFFENAKTGETYNIRNICPNTYLVTTRIETRFNDERIQRSVVWQQKSEGLRKLTDFTGKDSKQLALWYLDDLKNES